MDSFSDNPPINDVLYSASSAENPDAIEALQESCNWRSVLMLVVAGGATGLLIAWNILATALLPHILKPAQGIEFQQVASRLPVPRLLSWNLETTNRLIALRDLHGSVRVLLAIIVFSILWLLLSQVLNPSYHPLRLHLPRKGGLLEGAFETDNPVRTVLAIVFTMLALVVVYAVMSPREVDARRVFLYPAHDTAIELFRFTAWGIILWLCLTPGGLMDVLIHPARSVKFSKQVLCALLGVIWGVLSFIPIRMYVPNSLTVMLLRLQQLGPFNLRLYNEITGHYVAILSCVWMAAMCWAVTLAPRSRIPQRITAACAAVVLIGVCRLNFAWFTPSHLMRRYDISPRSTSAVLFPYRPDHPISGVPDGVPAATLLAQKLHLHFMEDASSPAHSLLVFRTHGQPVSLLLHGYTVDGLNASKGSTRRTAAFLQRRKYMSALAWTAVEHLFDCYALRFNTSAALEVLMEDLAQGPFAGQCNPAVLTMFFTCAASKTNAALLDEWADSRRFSHPDRFSRRLIGDLYRRFGQKQKALEWYKRADMPPSFMAARQSERPMFHTGSVSGTLMLNGKPLTGARVGVMPWRMNGLPVSLAFELHNAIGEIYAVRPSSPIFGPFQPGPFALRWLSEGTVTDQTGNFRLGDLTEGQYRLLVELPSTIHLTIPIDPHLKVINGVAPFVVSYNSPSHNCGKVRLELSSPPAAH